MKANSKQELFETIPVSKAIFKLAVPTILAMLVTIIYNLADTFFVGKLGDPDQVAAVALSNPLFVIFMSIGSFFGVGGSSYISRMLGVKNFKTIKRASSFCFYSSLVIGLVMICICLPLLDSITNILGTSKDTFGYTKDYIRIIIYGAPFIVINFSLSQIVRAEGSATHSMLGMMIGDILNIILDPIFILSLGMGVTGAAIATSLSSVISTIYFIIYLLRKSEYLSICPKISIPDKIILKNILAVGLPALLTNILMSIANIVLNNVATSYGDDVVAALGIVTRISAIPIFILIGLFQGVIPLIGYNYAAKNYKRMKEAMFKSGVIATVSSTVITIILLTTSETAIKIFINNKKIISLGSYFLKAYVCTIPILGIMFLFNGAFQAFGKGIPSTILAISRQGFIFIPIVLLGSKYFGVNGVVFAQPIADIFGVVLSIIMAVVIFKKENLNDNKAAT